LVVVQARILLALTLQYLRFPKSRILQQLLLPPHLKFLSQDELRLLLGLQLQLLLPSWHLKIALDLHQRLFHLHHYQSETQAFSSHHLFPPLGELTLFPIATNLFLRVLGLVRLRLKIRLRHLQ
jgi:hypothetical protein